MILRIPVTLGLVLAASFALIACALAGREATEQPDSGQPNIVFILTDDMRADELEYMPKTKSLIADQGVTYDNAFVTTSQCCPSRATILRGQYAHNHQVLHNQPPLGGYEKFRDQGHESSTVATWLDDAGYTTALFGKYLNHYSGEFAAHVPLGWDEWYVRIGKKDEDSNEDRTTRTEQDAKGTKNNESEGGYLGYSLSENGQKVDYDSRTENYLTDVLSYKATDFISRTPTSNPLFVYLATAAPHEPAVPAPRHEDMFDDEEIDRSRPNYNEADVSDKPQWVQDQRLSSRKRDRLDDLHKDRLRSLQAVDEMVESVVDELEATGRLSNTYLVFASDNGFHMGEHRYNKKNSYYEESIRVPLLVRGPGVPAGRYASEVALNSDLAPTFAELAGAATPEFVDGRSLVPTFSGKPSSWRTAFLHEFWSEGKNDVPEHAAVRTSDGEKLIDIADDNFKEYYDLASDPYELDNSYWAADPSLIELLERRLKALKNCAGESCRAAEDTQ